MNGLFKEYAACDESKVSGDRFSVWLFAIFVLTLVNIIFFWPHYLGDAIFPWDFYGGYHSMAYAWLQDGSFISPPLWSPYGNYGFPTHLAMQNSSFYLPLVVLDWLNIPYTLHVAATLQCLHILVGSIGFYYFLRLSGIGILTAITGGILFHLSVGFFSNAQHVDIIRGYAITPWLFVAFSRHFLTDYKKAVFSAWVTFLFLTGAYPGIVVAVFYVMLLYAAGELIQQVGTHNKKQFIKYVAVSGSIAIMLSCIKYLQLIVQLDELSLVPVAKNIGISLQHYLTVFFRFDLDFIKGDITMRSYYLPALTFILLFFTGRLTRLWLLGLLMVVFALLFVTEGEVRQWAMALPGFSVSRSPLSDYRGLVHIALVTMACASLNVLSKQGISLRNTVWRGFLVLIFFILISLTALSNGYQLDSMVSELTMMLISLIAFVLVAPYLSSGNEVKQMAAFVSIWVMAIAATYVYVSHAPITWRFDDYKMSLGTRVYGQDLDKLFTDVDRHELWPSRPDRILMRGNVGGNIGYYSQVFSQTGYDNGLRLKRTMALKRMLESDQGSELKNFLAQESRFILTEQLPDNARDICMEEQSCNRIQGGLVTMQEFGLSHSLFRVDLDKDAWLMENELYFPGWKSEICEKDVCMEGPEASVAVDFLRAWRLPKGQYTIRTYYQPPLWGLSQIIFWLALIVSMVLVIGKCIRLPFLPHKNIVKL